MHTFRHILVDLDATAPAHPVFAQACDLAAGSGARLRLVDVMEDVPRGARHAITPKLENELVDHRLEALSELARQRSDVSIETAVLRGKPGVSLIREVLRSNHDLVIRAHGRDLVPARSFGPIDTQLLRECPCPVWLVGPEERQDPRHILAAVDAASDVPEADELNRTIIDVALTMGEAERAEITVLHAWTLFGEYLLKSRMDEEEHQQALEDARLTASEALDTLIEEFGDRSSGVRRECIKGEPAIVIRDFVTTRHVDLVVMGTVARTGVSGLLIGNTAEGVLQQLNGSVVAVKPPGFVTPVTLPGSGKRTPSITG